MGKNLENLLHGFHALYKSYSSISLLREAHGVNRDDHYQTQILEQL